MNEERLAWRCLAAFGLDYLLILLYMGLLALVSLTFLTPRLSLNVPWQTQLLGFTTLTLPVGLYFALSESFGGGTLGKRWLGLKVTDETGAPLLLHRSLLRSGLKFAPWELSHTAVYRLIPWTVEGAALSFGQWTFLLGFYALSFGLAASYVVGLFRGQPLHDRVARSRVRAHSPRRFA